MKNNKIGYAVVGLGVGKTHAKAVSESKNADLVAVCDLLQEKLDKAKEQYPDVLVYRDFDEMLKNPDIDIVSVCVPSYLHAEFAVRAMEAGKNVLVEKPIDITVEAAMRIEEARKRTGKIAAVVHQNRNNADMKPIKEAVDSGRIGKLLFGEFCVKWWRTQEYFQNDGGWRGTWDKDGGGSLMNQAVHTVDLMQWLMGDVESVTSQMDIYNHKIETEDFTSSIIKFKSGARAIFISTTCSRKGSTGIMLYGSKGAIEANGDTITGWNFEDNKDGEEDEMRARYAGNAAAAAQDPKLCTGHASIIENVIEAVRDHKDPQILPLEAIKSVRIVNAVYESARTGKTVYFD